VAALGLLLLCAACPAFAQSGAAAAQPAANDWVARSNEHAQVLLHSLATFNPEMAGYFGVEGLDEQVIDLGPHLYERARKSLVAARTELEKRLAAEKDPQVRLDLEILIQAANESIEEADAQHRVLVPFIDVPQTVFLG
jgi:hypothetical protein